METGLSKSELGSIVGVATALAVISAYQSDLTGIQQLTSAAITWIVAIGAGIVAMRFFDRQ